MVVYLLHAQHTIFNVIYIYILVNIRYFEILTRVLFGNSFMKSSIVTQQSGQIKSSGIYNNNKKIR